MNPNTAMNDRVKRLHEWSERFRDFVNDYKPVPEPLTVYRAFDAVMFAMLMLIILFFSIFSQRARDVVAMIADG